MGDTVKKSKRQSREKEGGEGGTFPSYSFLDHRKRGSGKNVAQTQVLTLACDKSNFKKRNENILRWSKKKMFPPEEKGMVQASSKPRSLGRGKGTAEKKRPKSRSEKNKSSFCTGLKTSIRASRYKKEEEQQSDGMKNRTLKRKPLSRHNRWNPVYELPRTWTSIRMKGKLLGDC